MAGYGFRILFPLGIVLLAVLAHNYNLLLFHTLAELFAIFVAFVAAIVAWYTYPFSRNDFLMYLGLGYAFVGGLDLMHAISFAGMPLVKFSGANASTQFWIGARYLEAFVLVSAPLFLSRPFSRPLWLATFSLVAMVISWSIIGGWFPDTYHEGQGLTPFKVGSEYFIVVLLCAAAIFIWWRRALLDASILRLMMASLVLTAAAELSFTVYIKLSDFALLTGHIFRFFSYWMIFVAVVRTTLTRPFLTMARTSTTYDAIPDAIVVVNKHGLIHQANRAACAWAGISEEALLGSHCHEHFHVAGMPPEQCPVCIAIGRGEAASSLELAFPENGAWTSFSLSPVEANNERPGMVHVFFDITERKQAEQGMRRAREELESRVRERTADLLGTNARLEAEIREREQIQAALMIAKEEAEAANRAKSEFLSKMSHELRTPLNAILGFAQLLKADADITASEELDDNVEQILKAGWHLLELIDEVLDLAKIESGRFNLSLERVMLRQVLSECLEQSKLMAEQRGVTMHCDLEHARQFCVRADHMRLKQVLNNLVSNAVKYNATNGRVDIEVRPKDNDRVEVRVTDTGPGITEQDLAHLFRPFNRLGAEKTEIEGTGVGLVISKRLVELMGGEIGVHSRVGKGSMFFVELTRSECDDGLCAAEG